VALEAVEDAIEHVVGNAAPRSLTLNTISSPRRIAASVTVCPGAEKPTALESRLNRHLADAPAVGAQRADVVGADDAQLDFDSLSRPARLSAAAFIASMTSTSSGLSSSAPASIEARSRMSLMIASRAAEDWVMKPAYSICLGLSGPTRHRPRAGEPMNVGQRRAQLVGERD